MSEQIKKSGERAYGAIFGDINIEAIKGKTGSKQILEIPLVEIEPNPDQVRKLFDEEALDDLAGTIETGGLRNPIIVRKVEEKSTGIKYQIVSGERRYRAHKKLGKEKIEAILLNVSDDNMATEALIENLQRENLSVMETAEAVNKLKDRYKTIPELSKAISKNERTIQFYLRIGEMPKTFKDLVKIKGMDFKSARELGILISKTSQMPQDVKERIHMKILKNLDSLETIKQDEVVNLKHKIFGQEQGGEPGSPPLDSGMRFHYRPDDGYQKIRGKFYLHIKAAPKDLESKDFTSWAKKQIQLFEAATGLNKEKSGS